MLIEDELNGVSEMTFNSGILLLTYLSNYNVARTHVKTFERRNRHIPFQESRELYRHAAAAFPALSISLRDCDEDLCVSLHLRQIDLCYNFPVAPAVDAKFNETGHQRLLSAFSLLSFGNINIDITIIILGGTAWWCAGMSSITS